MTVMTRIRALAGLAVAAGALAVSNAWAADLKVGFITSPVSYTHLTLPTTPYV